MRYLPSIFISAAVALVSAWGLYSFAPVSLFGWGTEPMLGATITTIQGTDTLSASRTTINTNFANLNASKLEISAFAATTTMLNLAVTGVLASSTFRGSIIEVPYGGTGSSTLSVNQVLLGNGSSAFKTVSGYGNSGEALVSTGSGSAPTWQSISFDNVASYTLTGAWTFSATTSQACSNVLSNACILNGLPYRFPTALTASSTVLAVDASGNLSWVNINRNLSRVDANIGTADTSTTTLATVAIPASTIGGNHKALRYRADFLNTAAGGNCTYDIQLGTGSASSTISASPIVDRSSQHTGHIYATSTNQFFAAAQVTPADAAIGIIATPIELASVHFAPYLTSQLRYLSFRARASGGAVCTLIGQTVELLQS